MKRYLEIYDKYKEDILNQRLVYNDNLPSIRATADHFGYSKTTVEHAYEKLMEEGYIRSKPQSGYCVDMDTDHLKLHQKMKDVDPQQTIQEPLYDFRIRAVSPDSFDVRVWRHYMREVSNDVDTISRYGDPQGEMALRIALKDYSYRQRGVLSTPDSILIGSGFQALLFLVCSMIPKASHIVFCKDSSLQVKRVFQSFGFVLSEIDDEHFFDYLQNHKVDYVYVNSACFSSSFRPMTIEERKRLASLSKKNQFCILEDDYNGELTYISSANHSIQSLAVDQTIYFGSFSYLLVPSLRISYAVLNEPLMNIYQDHKTEFGPTASKFEQLALARYISDGHLEKHLRKMKRKYALKAHFAKDVLDKYFSHFTIMEAYLAMDVTFHGIDKNELSKHCQEAMIALDILREEHFALSFSTMDEQAFSKGVSLLVKCLKEC